MESFNGKLRDELLNGELFDTLHEAQVLVERWRQRYKVGTAAARADIIVGGNGIGCHWDMQPQQV